jgi:Mrp family chromosome partitioning ATPase
MSRNYKLLQRLERERQRNRTQAFAAATLDPSDNDELLVEVPAGPNLRPPLRSSNGLSEIKTVVNHLFLLPGAESPRLVTFTPISAKSDAAFLAARAGELLESFKEGTVCIVDANFGNPTLHEHFGVQNRVGLAGALQQAGPIQHFASQRGGLWLMTSGKDSDGKALFRSDALPVRMEELRSAFDFTLVAAPPMSTYAESVLLSKHADGVVLILEANETRRLDAMRAKDDLQAANAKLLGAVLNNYCSPIPESLYSRFFVA